MPVLENVGIAVEITILRLILSCFKYIYCVWAAILDVWLPIASDNTHNIFIGQRNLENIGKPT